MAGMMQEVQDPILKNLVDGIEAKIPPEQKRAYLAIVVAGMKILFSDQTHKFLIEAIKKNAKDIPTAAVRGAVKLIAVIYKESKGKMKVGLAPAAGITLLCYILDYAEKSTGESVPKEKLAQLIQAFVIALMKTFKITQEQLAQGVEYNKKNAGAVGGTTPPVPSGAGSPTPAPQAPGGGIIQGA